MPGLKKVIFGIGLESDNKLKSEDWFVSHVMSFGIIDHKNSIPQAWVSEMLLSIT